MSRNYSIIDGVVNTSGYTVDANPMSSKGNGCIVAMLIGGGLVIAVVGVALIAAPVVGAAGCGKIANKGMKGKGLKKRAAATALAGLGAFAGTAAIQKQVMPSVHEVQIQFVQDLIGGAKEAPTAAPTAEQVQGCQSAYRFGSVAAYESQTGTDCDWVFSFE